MSFKDQLTPQQIVEFRAERHRMSQMTINEQLDYLSDQLDCLDRGEIWTPARAEEAFTKAVSNRPAEPDVSLRPAPIKPAPRKPERALGGQRLVTLE
jgi:hypothetical protein